MTPEELEKVLPSRKFLPASIMNLFYAKKK
jgi:hypothetical protein